MLKRLAIPLVLVVVVAVVPDADAKKPSNRARIHQLEKQVRGDRASIRSLRAMIRTLQADVAALSKRTTTVEATASDAVNVAQSLNWCLMWSFVDGSFAAFLDTHCIKGRDQLGSRDEGPKP